MKMKQGTSKSCVFSHKRWKHDICIHTTTACVHIYDYIYVTYIYTYSTEPFFFSTEPFFRSFFLSSFALLLSFSPFLCMYICTYVEVLGAACRFCQPLVQK